TRYIIRANVRGGYLDDAVTLILNLATVLILIVGARRMETSSVLRAGDVIAVIQYVALIMNAVLMLSWTIAWLPHLRVSVRRIGEVLDLPSEESAASEHATLSGDLVLSDVTFSYPGGEAPVLSDISFSVPRGEVVALIGGTGSGKSTLVKLLLDFYTPEEGSITFGGTDYRTLPRAAVRNNFSVALQKSMIFEGSVRDNVRMGNEKADDEEILRALDIAEMSPFLAMHEEGLDYRLAGAGTNISGGQKQRINIARALTKPAEVYIFDDSFSALDYLTESRLRQKLNRALEGKTQIVVTQRAATAMRCDRIFVLDGGRLVGAGRHEELLDSCTVYREIYDSQLGSKDAVKGGDAR
ncbi:MAG TPA: multidrug ABC transporter ATP-binding protein, partial [Clostridiales bacterium]|nr:multidrug ABC transporter ATP-binding protein [Clostridiales bacterium]